MLVFQSHTRLGAQMQAFKANPNSHEMPRHQASREIDSVRKAEVAGYRANPMVPAPVMISARDPGVKIAWPKKL